MNISQRLLRGRQIIREQHITDDVKRRGNLRAGSTGAMSTNGDIMGGCHRKLHLRTKGIEVEVPNDSKLVMFQMGLANEDVVYNDLVQTSQVDEVILREEQIPIEWYTKNGTRVTGRPDMVICKNIDGVVTPQLGIELKSVASVWTSREVLFNGTPKADHLLQSAHYAWKLGIPYRLIYKQYGNQAIPSWAHKLFPKRGEPHSEHIEYNDKGEVKNINPYEIVYEVIVSKGGKVSYRREVFPGSVESKTIKTVIKVSDINRFYEFTSKIESSKDLGPRPMTADIYGEAKNYSNCDYCPLLPICKKSEKNYDEWIDGVNEHIKQRGTP